jgi:hypothetical protein
LISRVINIIRNMATDFKDEEAQWRARGLETFFKMIKENSTVTADTYRAYCRRIKMPPKWIAATSAAFFRSFYHQNYLAKSKAFVLSESSSRPLPLYHVNRDNE